MALVLIISDTDPPSDHNRFRGPTKGLAAEQNRLLRASPRGNAKAENRGETECGGWQEKLMLQLLPTVYPQGIPLEARNKEVYRAFASEFEKRGLRPPHRSTVERFLKRYRRRH